MKLETLAKRVAQKAGAPELEECLVHQRAPESMDCMIWTGKKTREGLFPKMVRDSDGRPGMEPVMVHSRPMIRYNRRENYADRLVFSLTTGREILNRRLEKICGEPLCVNPNHSILHELPEDSPPPPPPPPEEEDDWSVEEAVELLEIYLTTNRPPIDPEHPLLLDIPEDIMAQAKEQMGQ